jgi:hypothetical protein
MDRIALVFVLVGASTWVGIYLLFK